MIIRHICFSSPIKDPAHLEFGYGLNLIYGASNTGKSSVLDAIDFMLGREHKMKELPEHVGYDRLFLGIEFSDGEEITLVRSIDGGDFQCFEGLHYSIPDNQDALTLREKRSTQAVKSVSDFILEKIQLEGKKLKKNAKNETEKLTLRTLLPLSLITEIDIQKEISPFHTVQYTKATVEKSRLKLLLTGTDDSSLISHKDSEKNKLSRTARIEVLKELIDDQKEKFSHYIDEESDLQDFINQSENLSSTINDYEDLLGQVEGDYLEALDNLNATRKKLRYSNERLTEIEEMLVRFDLLNDHYATDILRLEGIIESGSLITAMSSVNCPLCGADQENQNLNHECDGNIDTIVEGATAEAVKVNVLKNELSITVNQLNIELRNIEQAIPKIEKTAQEHQEQLSILSPDISEKRTSYVDLRNKKAEIDKAIDSMKILSEFEERISTIESEKEKETQKKDDTKMPTSCLDELAIEAQFFLKKWSLPNVDRIHFDNTTNDLVLNGKQRSSNGKGHRSITHAAVTLGLMKYLEGKGLPSIGFTILDSPLLAYEEPENDEDDLSGTDVNKLFFESLSEWKTKQTIIFENKKSIPKEMESGHQIVLFSKNEHGARYGFFPVENNTQ